MNKIMKGEPKTGWTLCWGYAGGNRENFRSQKKYEQRAAELAAEGEDFYAETYEYAEYKRFPIEGKGPPKVEDRPRCPCCAKPLRPNFVDNEYLGVRRWQGYKSYGHFCTLNCAQSFANWVLNTDLDTITSAVKSLRRHHNLVPQV